MRKYLFIYLTLLKNAFSYEAQYRRDTWLHLASNFLYLGLLSATIEVVFRHTPELNGWSREETYLLMLLWIIADELFTMVSKHNLWNLPGLVTDGALDAYLTKPANTLFLVSTKIFLMRAGYRLFIQIGFLVWLVWSFDFAPSLWHGAMAIVLVIGGALVHYSFSLILNTLSFWWLRIDNINDAWESLSNMGRYPLGIFPKFVRVLRLTFLPIAFIGYIPAAAMTGRAGWWLILYAFA